MSNHGHRIEVGNLSLNGCEACPLASWANRQVGELPPSEDLSMLNFLGALKHYALELNSLKKEHNPMASTEPVNTDENIVLGMLLKAGFSLEEAESVVPEFLACVECPEVLSVGCNTFVDGEVFER